MTEVEYDVTMHDADRAGVSVRKYERYLVAAAAWRLTYEAQPTDRAARVRMAKAHELAERYYKEYVEEFEKQLIGPRDLPKPHLRFEPGVDATRVRTLALCARDNHDLGVEVHDDEHIESRTGIRWNTRSYDLEDIRAFQAEMDRDLERSA